MDNQVCYENYVSLGLQVNQVIWQHWAQMCGKKSFKCSVDKSTQLSINQRNFLLCIFPKSKSHFILIWATYKGQSQTTLDCMTVLASTADGNGSDLVWVRLNLK